MLDNQGERMCARSLSLCLAPPRPPRAPASSPIDIVWPWERTLREGSGSSIDSMLAEHDETMLARPPWLTVLAPLSRPILPFVTYRQNRHPGKEAFCLGQAWPCSSLLVMPHAGIWFLPPGRPLGGGGGGGGGVCGPTSGREMGTCSTRLSADMRPAA